MFGNKKKTWIRKNRDNIILLIIIESSRPRSRSQGSKTSRLFRHKVTQDDEDGTGNSIHKHDLFSLVLHLVCSYFSYSWISSFLLFDSLIAPKDNSLMDRDVFGMTFTFPLSLLLFFFLNDVCSLFHILHLLFVRATPSFFVIVLLLQNHLLGLYWRHRNKRSNILIDLQNVLRYLIWVCVLVL